MVGEKESSIRVLAVKGGAYLSLRELLGMLVRLGGVATVTHIIGPSGYGTYFAAATFVALIASAAQMGAELWLIRLKDDPTPQDLNEVWTSLLVVSVLLTAASLLVSYVIGMFVPSSDIEPFRLLVLSVPLNVLWAPGQALIERKFEYRKMAWLELGGDVVLYGIAVPLAFVGFGVDSLVLGFIGWQAFLLVASLRLAHFRPRLRWNRSATGALIRHGVGYSSTGWATQLGTASVTVLVGSFAGAADVGFVGLALRLIDTVGFGIRATARISMAALSRLVDDRPRMGRALEQGMIGQLAIVALPMLVVVLPSTTLIPLIFGHQWAPAIPLFCLLCIGRVIASPFILQTTMLYVEGRISSVLRANIVIAVLTWTFGLPLTLFFGPTGYVWGMVGATVGYYLVHRATMKVVQLHYRNVVFGTVAVVPGLVIPLVHFPGRWFLLLPLLVAVRDGRLRGQVGGLIGTVLKGARS
jgi:O-antigen/teichoic acid export membrane protein